MGNSGFLVVIVVILVALAAGYLYAGNDQLSSQMQISQAAMTEEAARIATLSAQSTLQAEHIERQNAAIADQQKLIQGLKATQMAIQPGCKPQTSREDQTVAFVPTPTPEKLIPVNGGVAQATLPGWATSLGAGLVGVIVFAAYRKYRVEDTEPEPRPVKTRRAYAADERDETIYVKMTRQEARDYARSRAKAK